MFVLLGEVEMDSQFIQENTRHYLVDMDTTDP